MGGLRKARDESRQYSLESNDDYKPNYEIPQPIPPACPTIWDAGQQKSCCFAGQLFACSLGFYLEELLWEDAPWRDMER